MTNWEIITLTITGMYTDWKSYKGKLKRRDAYNKISNPGTNNHNNGHYLLNKLCIIPTFIRLQTS